MNNSYTIYDRAGNRYLTAPLSPTVAYDITEHVRLQASDKFLLIPIETGNTKPSILKIHGDSIITIVEHLS